jgi:hypothetical protein
MLQLMYNVHTCDHAMCPNFYSHYEIHLQLILTMIPIDTISMGTNAPLPKYYYSIML